MCRESCPKKARTSAVASDGGGDDRISDLPIELRARITSFLSYQEVVQLTVLSQPWRFIHHHTPVVKINLADFLHLPDIFFDDKNSAAGFLDDHSILAVRAALGLRARDGSASKVDTLRLAFSAADPRMLRHVKRIVALADARRIHVRAPFRGDDDAVPGAWALDLGPAARHLEVDAFGNVMPAIAWSGAAALRKLSLGSLVLSQCPPHLPSLRALTLDAVTVEAPFAPGQWCPLLEHLDLFCCKLESARVDIRLQHLQCLVMEYVDVHPRGQFDDAGPPFGRVAVDAPDLAELHMIFDRGCTRDFKSFQLRAPKLRVLCWHNQFAERMVIDVGRPVGSVKEGKIEFMSVYYRGRTFHRDQIMRILQGLLPDVPPDSVADIARPYLKAEECRDSDDEEDNVDEKLTCNLSALMSRGI